MRAYLERLEFETDSSLRHQYRPLDYGIPFQWHHHPLFELTMTLNSRGQRFIGDHVGAYDNGDLVLVGPNLPHTWFSRSKINSHEPHLALVIWFKPDWAEQLVKQFAEYRSVTRLLEKARSGCKFSGITAEVVRPDFERFFRSPPRDRLMIFLSVISKLMEDEGQELSRSAATIDSQSDGAPRIERVLTHIHEHYAEGVRVEHLADIAALSLSGLHRLFTKHTGRSVTAYVAQMRIGEACARLSGTDQPISHIADVVGFNNLANFNRQFRAQRGMTPREYRSLFRK
jgi:AraC-like DNA-binding protein